MSVYLLFVTQVLQINPYMLLLHGYIPCLNEISDTQSHQNCIATVMNKNINITKVTESDGDDKQQ